MCEQCESYREAIKKCIGFMDQAREKMKYLHGIAWSEPDKPECFLDISQSVLDMWVVVLEGQKEEITGYL